MLLSVPHLISNVNTILNDTVKNINPFSLLLVVERQIIVTQQLNWTLWIILFNFFLLCSVMRNVIRSWQQDNFYFYFCRLLLYFSLVLYNVQMGRYFSYYFNFFLFLTFRINDISRDTFYFGDFLNIVNYITDEKYFSFQDEVK